MSVWQKAEIARIKPYGIFRSNLPNLSCFACNHCVLLAKKPVFAIILASLIASIGPGAIAMVQTFQAMMVYGTGDPALMAGGISKALTTSVLSLIVFVPLLIFVQWIGRKLRAKKLTKADVNSTFE